MYPALIAVLVTTIVYY
ncbi:hypothetical protein XELAEV_180200582mg, partial [Xenopus laevis]